MSSESKPEKTLIGVLAPHDDRDTNQALVSIFTHFFNHPSKETLENFHFVFTGGTHDRIFFGDENLSVNGLHKEVANWIRNGCGVTRLPSATEGGVTILSYLITQRKCSIIWPLFSFFGFHWLRPENLALLRLCDQWHVKRLMNRGSVLVWFDLEAEADVTQNLQETPPELKLFPEDDSCSGAYEFQIPDYNKPRRFQEASHTTSLRCKKVLFQDLTIAIIAHDEMKARMIDFAIDYETELRKFGRILATGTTGREVAAATSRKIEEKMVRYHSGPKGGDIEIATAILYGQCHVIVFFIDPLRPHPHIEDIRVIFEACMVNNQVVMITNEMHAREFMSRVVRGKESLVLYER